MIRLATFFLVLPVLLIGNAISDNKLSSTQASYDGNALILQGGVHLDHALGHMNAEQASLQKQEVGKDFPFSFIQLKQDVFLSLKNKAELRCDTAQLDFNELTGALASSDEGQVSYKGVLGLHEPTPVPFHLKSRLVDLTFRKDDASNQNAQYAIASLIAKQGVQIDYARDFSLYSDEASYHSKDPKDKCSSDIIKAFSKIDGAKCKITYQNETIESDSISIDSLNRLLTMENPEGTLPSKLFAQSHMSPLFFRCQHLEWNHLRGTLSLKNQITIQESTLGTLYAENEMIIEQITSQETQCIKSVSIEGPSHLKHTDPASGWHHSLSCFGSLFIDGLKGQVFLTSPPEQEKQLLYQDKEMILRANESLIEFSETSYQPLSLSLKGNVTIQSADPAAPMRFGLADRLSYSPSTQTVILSALPKNKVLFQDDEQNITMSAQEVHLTKDPTTGETQVKGIGKVTFSLSAEEQLLLNTWNPSYTQDNNDESK